ncbi:hypothetical protein PINS_up002709 [Pythium insidiosum]|nr:hypothetical protein PINS_up002709 [Pythium insidiosum]
MAGPASSLAPLRGVEGRKETLTRTIPVRASPLDSTASNETKSRRLEASRLTRASTYRVPDRRHDTQEDKEENRDGDSNDGDVTVASASPMADGEKKRRKKTQAPSETTTKPTMMKSKKALRRTATEPSRLRQVHVAEAPSSMAVAAMGADPATSVPAAVAPAVDAGGAGAPAAEPKAAVRMAKTQPLEQPFGEMIESKDVGALCIRCGLNKQDVWQLRRAFNSEDTESKSTITLASFFFLIGEEKRTLTKSLRRLAQAPSVSTSRDAAATRLSFDEFLRVVVTFASFTEREVLSFFFETYAWPMPLDRAELLLSEHDLAMLSNDLQSVPSAFARNVQVATAKSTALLTFTDFEQLARQHSLAFLFPLLQIQRNVRQTAALGEAFWRLKTRERQSLEQLLAFMRAHHGLLPPLSLKDRVITGLLGRETAMSRRRALAQRLYHSLSQRE